jgi:dTDP-4-dehydrorhamnose reductase
MKILLTGKNGQVGYELERSLQGLGEIIAVDRSQMDLANLDQVRGVIRAVKPALIVNAAAYTAVDKAESEPELAMRINGEAPGVMAEEAKKLGAAMIHYSTDYVFDGTKTTPYVETDPTCPINVYGHTKLAGEQAIQAADIPHLILRTSWVYGMRGKNFLLTILRLAQERDELHIVADQVGSPTWCRTVAEATARVVITMDERKITDLWAERSGIFHLASQGQTTWFDFARAILENTLIGKMPEMVPIKTSEYLTPARRPAYSVMSSQRFGDFFCNMPSWEKSLKLCVRS